MNKKVLKIFVEISLIIACCVCFALINEVINERKKMSFVPVVDSDSFAYQIESIAIEDKKLVVKGWFFELKKVRNTPKNVNDGANTGIVLYDLKYEDENNKNPENPRNGIALHVEYIDRNDVNKYFSCEYNYSHCGFIARTDVSNINLTDGKYQIIIKPDTSDTKGITSNAYINMGKLQYVDPRQEINLDFTDPELNKIVNEGVCLASCPENNVYIYQYEWKIFWIADKGFAFDDNEKTTIQFQAFTTQFDKLPSHRLLNGWDNIGDTFENNEVRFEENSGDYRISSRDIPRDYSIVSLLTGQNIAGQWLWKEILRPVYTFDK